MDFPVKQKALTTSAMLRFLVEYTEALRRVRKRIKGLLLCSLQAVDLLGEYPEGIRICQLTKDRYNQKMIHSLFSRERKRGYITKTGSTYYLTDKGRQAYNALYSETKELRKNIIDSVTKEVQKRLKNTI